ncbi:DUF1080 domain-containing protein [Akkermansiaceae bacterium]|nr:DUF1080 domain-containing protein [Akkermansiaceae bacterium]MDB4544332.1 DUF1080 domain-containing protein [Akkermansiaceae bacterium]
MKIALTLLTLTLSFSLVQGKKSDKPFWTDPAKAKNEDPDFSIQGEYGKGEPGRKLGAQVVALGDGKFDAYILADGLPGLGWERGKSRLKLSGSLKDGIVTFAAQKGTSALIENGKITIQREGKEPLVLRRIQRASATLGAKPPKDAVVLFDGSTAEHWKNGKMENGLLLSTGCTSIPTFKDYQLHLKFRTPYRPFERGQGRGNSGVYFSGRWETQILDSFGLEGKMNECGGIYSIAESRLNMCLPPLSWQTYDVDFTSAKFNAEGKRTAWPRITVKLNGVVVHDNVELNKDFTTAAPKNYPLKDEGSPVFLQNHGNPVYFQNIWVLPKK